MKIKFEYNENNENDLFVKKRRVKENQNETKKFSKQNQKITTNNNLDILYII